MTPEQRKRYADAKMLLPEGKTCGGCVHLRRCTQLFGVNPANTWCDFAPSRFVPALELFPLLETWPSPLEGFSWASVIQGPGCHVDTWNKPMRTDGIEAAITELIGRSPARWIKHDDVRTEPPYGGAA